MKVVSASGNTVTAVCSAARRALGIKIKDSREVLRSGGDDGLWRVHLADGTIVEATIKQRTPCEVYDIRTQ